MLNIHTQAGHNRFTSLFTNTPVQEVVEEMMHSSKFPLFKQHLHKSSVHQSESSSSKKFGAHPFFNNTTPPASSPPHLVINTSMDVITFSKALCDSSFIDLTVDDTPTTPLPSIVVLKETAHEEDDNDPEEQEERLMRQLSTVRKLREAKKKEKEKEKSGKKVVRSQDKLTLNF